jgi:hypothetical protein
VDVLEDHHLRQALGFAQHQPAERVEQLPPTLLRIHAGHGLVVGVDAEEVADVGPDRSQILGEPQDSALDLCDDLVLVIAVLDSELPPHEVDQGMKGDRAAKREAAAFHPARLAPDPPTQLEQQARLADAGLPDDEHHLTLPGSRLLEAIPEGAQFTLTPHEGGQPPFGLDVDPAPGGARRHDLPRRHRLRLALQAELAERAQVKEACGQTIDRLGNHDRAWLRDLLHSGGNIRRVADGRVVHPEVVPDAAHHDQSRVEPQPDLEVDATLAPELFRVRAECPLDAKRGENRAPRMVLVSDGRAEERHDPVAEKLIDRSLVAMNLGQHRLEGSAHQTVNVLGVHALGE